MRYLFLLIISFSVIRGHAQRNKFDSLFLKNGSISIEGGVVFPVADYGATDYTRSAGYAKTGRNYRVSISYEFLSYLGFKLSYIDMQNQVNINELKNDYQADIAQVNGNIYSVNSDPYKLNGVMAGVYYPLRLFKTTLEIRAMAGLMNAVYPKTEIHLYDPYLLADRIDKTMEATANDPAYSFGIGIRHQLYKDLLLTGGLDFLYSEQTFSNLSTYIYTGNNVYVLYYQDSYKQYYQLFNFNIGIAYQFN